MLSANKVQCILTIVMKTDVSCLVSKCVCMYVCVLPNVLCNAMFSSTLIMSRIIFKGFNIFNNVRLAEIHVCDQSAERNGSRYIYALLVVKLPIFTNTSCSLQQKAFDESVFFSCLCEYGCYRMNSLTPNSAQTSSISKIALDV